VNSVATGSKVLLKAFLAAALPKPWQVFALFCVYSGVTLLRAQTVEIRLINGRNGHPITNTCMNIWVGDERKEPLAIPTDKNGTARLRLTRDAAKVKIGDVWKACGDFGVVNPVVERKDFIKVNVGHVVCEPHGTDFSWLAVMPFSTEQLLQQGAVHTNSCGKVTASPRPGELVLFVRPLNWWEALKE
jgi:hypothetical protein